MFYWAPLYLEVRHSWDTHEIEVGFQADAPCNYVIRYYQGSPLKVPEFPYQRGIFYPQRKLSYPKEWRSAQAEFIGGEWWYRARFYGPSWLDTYTIIITAVPDPYEPASQAGPYHWPYYEIWY